ncbi:conjugative transposon protein TraN [Echinicola vietnamensis]|uniref:Conjugative transposon TraN protein n=1 Tax=Echinicola vietnamensis (strain DSM 17526 / LMG 23754 / KMM 6221) TaxID=926556 RepID=L0FX67_ECHVK|nr:conjugative transposon protein TraN [Echinicola vietnamensis]AGA77623.1 conjugative transposon TraN protein [Echinicola vietnamensis DSM 17526]
MKKLCLLSLIALCFVSLAFAQIHPKAVLAPYPVEVGWDQTTVLIFPGKIKSADRGNGNVLAQKDAYAANVLKLKAGKRGFSESNLHVVTDRGKVYPFTVRYNPKPDKLTIDIGKQQQVEAAVAVLENTDIGPEQLERLSGKVFQEKGFLYRSDKNGKIKLRLAGIYSHKEVLFFLFELKNRSRIAYPIQQWRFTVQDRKQVKRTAERHVALTPLCMHYEKAKGMDGKGENRLVVAFPQFTIADAKKMVVRLFEENGDRSPVLSIKGKHLLKARPIINPQNQ